MECSQNQYYYKGECHNCQQCGPGQELSEDCGYGSGVEAYCTSCNAKSYKEDWGHHSCRLCQSCRRVNRHQRVPCTSKSNAVCGECLPGFYSKTRIDGLRDLECMPCGPSSVNEHQCTRDRGEGVEEVWSTHDPPPETAAAATVICGTLLVGMIAVSVFLLLYCRHTSLRKMFQGCAGSKNGSHSEDNRAADTAGNTETVVLNLEKDVQLTSLCEGSAIVDPPSSLKSHLNVCTFSGFPTATSEPQASYPSSSSETQPLMRNSTCSSCSLGGVSQRSSSSASSECPADPSLSLYDEANLYCASDHQETCQHTPVECTELDLQDSIAADGSGASVAIEAPTRVPRDSTKNVSAEQLNSPSVHSMQRPDSCANDDQQFSSNGLRCSKTASNIQSLVKRSCVLMQGVHLGRLPRALVESLALKLDPVFPGVKNYQQVALEMGVPLEVLQSLRGFEHVFQYLSSCTLHTVPDLVNTFHHLQRFDTLLLLCEYATKGQLNTCSH
ncbi:hypothetical protein JZ751_026986 [Albula glossodonta]|uniref:TNFR-Cys domain-containing protein n=1 Tax=Albula glossodonta TaxID=121402 RepID=A0A8T2NCR1_9TELE|nr:hypothetical protein JZ751_026986 [Albula glossodonta]